MLRTPSELHRNIKPYLCFSLGSSSAKTGWVWKRLHPADTTRGSLLFRVLPCHRCLFARVRTMATPSSAAMRPPTMTGFSGLEGGRGFRTRPRWGWGGGGMGCHGMGERRRRETGEEQEGGLGCFAPPSRTQERAAAVVHFVIEACLAPRWSGTPQTASKQPAAPLPARKDRKGFIRVDHRVNDGQEQERVSGSWLVSGDAVARIDANPRSESAAGAPAAPAPAPSIDSKSKGQGQAPASPNTPSTQLRGQEEQQSRYPPTAADRYVAPRNQRQARKIVAGT